MKLVRTSIFDFNNLIINERNSVGDNGVSELG